MKYIFVFFLIIGTIKAQSLINVTGNSITSGNLQVEYSIGEIATQTISGTTNYTQGILQPNYNISNVLNPEFDSKFNFVAFPNPTSDFIEIETNYKSFEKFEIFDLNGKIIATQSFNGKLVSFQNFPSGTYILKLSDNSNSKTLKINKQ